MHLNIKNHFLLKRLHYSSNCCRIQKEIKKKQSSNFKWTININPYFSIEVIKISFFFKKFLLSQLLFFFLPLSVKILHFQFLIS